MREVLKTLAALCAVTFIFVGTLSLTLFNIERRAFESSTYKQAFETQQLYERMPALLASALQVSIAQNPNAFPFLRELTAEDWSVTITSLLPPEELRAIADSALDSTFEYVNRRSDTIVVSLLPIKAQLAGPAGIDIVTQFLSAQPACTVEQLTQMALGMLGGDVALCNPPPEAMELFAPFIQSQLQSLTASFPNEVMLTPNIPSGTANDPRIQLHMVRSAIRFSPFFVVLLLLAIALFAVRSFRDWLVWWGWPLLITGAITGLIGLVAAPVVGAILQFVIQTQGAALLPPLLASTLGETASAVAGQMLIPVAIQGLVIAVIGLGMVMLSLLLPKPATYTSL